MVSATIRAGSVRAAVLCLLGVIAIVAGGAYLWLNWTSYAPPPKTFDGPSSDLKELTIVPTLDTPSPAGKSILWCSSFQLAWNELQGIIKEPVRIENAEAVCDRLNRAEQSLADISPDSVYAVAGFNRDGIVEKIKSDMQRRFPGVPVPELPSTADGITAFAHLDAAVTFEHPFEISPLPLKFIDSRGQETKVAAFGTSLVSSDSRTEEMLKQVQVLFAVDYNGTSPSEFALDLSKQTQPNQIILAVLKPAGTLSEMLTGMDRKIALFRKSAKPAEDFDPEALNHGESVTVPSMRWHISHFFKELEGAEKRLLNNCCRETYLGSAYQDIKFQLDSGGAKVSSSAYNLKSSATPNTPNAQHRPLTQFRFDQPYLIYFKKRDAKQPFFVMWVNDADLLIPANADQNR
jgi:hypothetical protein